jgi:oxygen-independent coproporphyrinogen-3 oxidase
MDSPRNSNSAPPKAALSDSRGESTPDSTVLEALLPRYSMAGPRYTSYPTAPAWKEELDSPGYQEILDALPHDGTTPHAIYVHVPFCRSLCHFCACNRVITQKTEPPVRFLDTIAAEAPPRT